DRGRKRPRHAHALRETDRSPDPAYEGVDRAQRRRSCRELIFREIRIRGDRTEQRETRTLGDERGVVVGRANDDEAGLTWNISEKRERAEHGLELRSPRARDDAQTIGT